MSARIRFEGMLSTSKWAKITKCSPDTALRDIQDLSTRGIMKKVEEAGGRSTNYELVKNHLRGILNQMTYPSDRDKLRANDY